jgi:hypothetical protein
VSAQDLPGFGFTNVPTEHNCKYSFDAVGRVSRARLESSTTSDDDSFLLKFLIDHSGRQKRRPDN